MSAHTGRSVRLFLVDGSPTGVVTAEIVNWTGHALLGPRADLASVRKRPEFQKTGVYFLLGEVATVSERRRVYIGESDDVGRRIERHSTTREDDFFERFCIFTSKDANLTKAHARYLESRLASIARVSGRAEVLNLNVPPTGTLPESDIANMEFFISQIELILPVLGFDILRPTSLASPKPADMKSGGALVFEDFLGVSRLRLELTDRKSGVKATALLDDSDYVVLKGSTARSTAKPSLEEHLSSYYSLREALIAEQALIQSENPNLLEFSRDVVFRSPSAASAVILGRSDNGRRTWRVSETNEILADYQDRLLKEAAE